MRQVNSAARGPRTKRCDEPAQRLDACIALAQFDSKFDP
jgi:hypothetical protein